MRVISQDGFYDLPYDSVWLMPDENDRKTIYAIPNPTMESLVNYDVGLPVMGEYSTEEKAKRAMDMLRNTYYDSLFQKTYKTDTNEFSAYFQFPADEELEE